MKAPHTSLNRRSFLSAGIIGIAISGIVAATLLLHGGTARSNDEPANAPRTAAIAEHVFIVSFDGGKPAVMQKSAMPTLFALLKQGAGTWEAQTILPSITLVSHTSMLTGVGPAKHGITWNDWKPEKGLVSVPTVFSIAKKADKKLVTAMFVGKEKFAHLFLPGSLDAFAMPDYSAKIVAAQAADYIVRKKPNLCFIHFADSDGAGHKYGWGTPEQVASFADEDAALATVLDGIRRAGIEKTSLIIMTADHGGHDKTHGSNRPEDMTIPWIVWGAGVKPGTQISAAVTTYDTSATALYALGIPIPAEFDGKPVVSAFENAPAPAIPSVTKP